MPYLPKKWMTVVGLVAVLGVGIALLFLRATILTPPKTSLPIVASYSSPEPPYPDIPLSPVRLTESELRQFFADDFKVVGSVELLPRSEFHAYATRGGLANPGERFAATDNITDPNIPDKRLIFAGTSRDKCFVYYEQGGIGLSYDLALFKTSPAKILEPVWRGYCGKAKSLAELKNRVEQGLCQSQ